MAHSYPNAESIHRTELDNDIVVLVYENFAVPSVEISGVLRAGALGAPSGKAGVANFCSAMLLRGTKERSFEEIYEALESVGASLSFSAGRHTAGFAGTALSEDLDLLLQLAASALRYPTFPAEQVEQLRGQLITGLQIADNNTRQRAGKLFRQTLFDGHPYGIPVEGDMKTIAGIQSADLTAFHKSYYGPAGMIFTVVGAIKADEALAKVKGVLGDWHNPNQHPMPDVSPATHPADTMQVKAEMPAKTQSDVVMGLPGPARSAPDYQVIRVANTILGVFGMYGRLGKTVREDQGLAYYVFSRLSGGLGPSPWFVSTGVAPDKVEQAIASIRAEIRRMQDEPVPAEELADIQAYLTGSMPVSLETNSGLASVISDIEMYQLGIDYLIHYPDNIKAITVEDVQKAARKYWDADNMVIAVAGP